AGSSFRRAIGTPRPALPAPEAPTGRPTARRATARRATIAARPPLASEETVMRIVGGRLSGRTLVGPKSQAIRPTSDRLRETLFNILVHAYQDPIAGARVLDLFAGTGALGLESLSRGAAFTLFVDHGAEARALMRQNVEA